MAKVGLIVGSLRNGAFTRLMARALPELAPSSLQFFAIEIGDLPFYNEDLETGSPPAPWTRFRQQVRRADGILFITPEYNRSIPGALKNALDVGSRPWGQSAWDGKPAAVIGQSPGALGAWPPHIICGRYCWRSTWPPCPILKLTFLPWPPYSTTAAACRMHRRVSS